MPLDESTEEETNSPSTGNEEEESSSAGKDHLVPMMTRALDD